MYKHYFFHLYLFIFNKDSILYNINKFELIILLINLKDAFLKKNLFSTLAIRSKRISSVSRNNFSFSYK